MTETTTSPSNCQEPHYIGIDGCRGGWILAWCKPGQPPELQYQESLNSCLESLPFNAVILIDMILYRSEDPSPRQFDRRAKKHLGPWHSRVFLAPPQESLNAESYADACALSQQISGKKISVQCYNLYPKIREANAVKHAGLIEYHPEIAFMELNQGAPLAPSKKTAEGRSLRRQCLKHFFGSLPDAPRHALPKKPWIEDDLLDALALAAAAQTGTYLQFYQALEIDP